MNRFDAVPVLGGEERRFFMMPGVGSVRIDLRRVSNSPQHADIAAALKNKGIFPPDAEIIGGYCYPLSPLKGVIYFGPPAGNLPAATKDEFDRQVDNEGIFVFNSQDPPISL